MIESVYERLKRSERATSESIELDVPVESVLGRVRRRRTARAVTSAAAGIALMSTGTVGAFAWSQADADEATSVAMSPTFATPVVTSDPAPTSEGEFPSFPDAPVMTAASQEVADAILNPRPGPSFLLGVRAPLDTLLSPAALSSCPDALCGMADIPPVTPDVLESGKLTAVIDEWGNVQGAVEMSDELRYLDVAGPEVGAFMAVDLSAWTRAQGLSASWAVADAAADDSGHRIMVVLEEYIAPGQSVFPTTVVLFDLDTATSTILAEDLDFASVEWDGSQWRLFGNGSNGALGALVSADGTSWTTEGMQVSEVWWPRERDGYTNFFRMHWGIQWLLLGDEVYAAEPEGLMYCNPPYDASEAEGYVRMSCAESADAQWQNFQLTQGEGWALLDPALESQAPPAPISYGRLGDGYVLWRPGQVSWYEGGVETPLDVPEVEPVTQGLADGGVWLLGFDQLGWIGPDLEYRAILTFPSDNVSPIVYPYGTRATS